jgi:hypothetical protein
VLQFRVSANTSDGGLLAYRELDDALGLTYTGADALADARTSKKGRHLFVGLPRQSVFGRLAGCEDVNDAERLCRDPAMRWVVDGPGGRPVPAFASQMGRFETKWLIRPENLTALADLPGQWIDKVHLRRPPRIVVLGIDSSESPTYGGQEGSAYSGHFGCTCYHPLFVLTVSRTPLRQPTAADDSCAVRKSLWGDQYEHRLTGESQMTFFSKCDPPHTSRPIPERCCLRTVGSGRSSGECRFKAVLAHRT